jgi:hypothetical protein
VNMERITLCLNTEDPEQKELFEFVTSLPNGKKRNASAFLKMLVDREYQKKREWYVDGKRRQEKKTHEASQGEVIKEKSGIRYIPKST